MAPLCVSDDGRVDSEAEGPDQASEEHCGGQHQHVPGQEQLQAAPHRGQNTGPLSLVRIYPGQG